jgi:nucleotide-binding universal stress UspA family protein
MTSSETQPHIVCAARGGQHIQPSVKRAIELACESNARLTFLYILDIEFMKHTSLGRTSLIFDALDKMGEFMMLRLCEYAAEGGCANADYAIRHGKVREEIKAYLAETRPGLLVLGRPNHGPEHEEPPAFEHEGIVRFAEEITRETGVRVELV